MFGLLLLASSLWADCTNQCATPVSFRACKLARVHLHCVNQCPIEPTPTVEFPAPLKPARIADESIPPSPAVLNAAGLHANASLVNERFLKSLWPYASEPIDTSQDPTDILPVTAEVADILDRWEAASRRMSPTLCRFAQTIYDLDEGTEARAEGTLYYESASIGGVRFRPAEIWRSEKSQRTGRDGNPLRLVAGPDYYCTWTRDEFYKVDHDQKTYSTIPIPAEVAHHVPSHGFLLQSLQHHAPLVFELQMDSIRRQWSFNLLREDRHQILLEAIPRTNGLKHRYFKCLVLIDSRSSRTTAVKYVSADENRETVYKLMGNWDLVRLEKAERTIGCVFFPKSYRRLP